MQKPIESSNDRVFFQQAFTQPCFYVGFPQAPRLLLRVNRLIGKMALLRIVLRNDSFRGSPGEVGLHGSGLIGVRA